MSLLDAEWVARWETAERMRKYGGAFVQALGAAFRSADLDNHRRLRAAFPELWVKYATMREARVDTPRAHLVALEGYRYDSGERHDVAFAIENRLGVVLVHLPHPNPRLIYLRVTPAELLETLRALEPPSPL